MIINKHRHFFKLMSGLIMVVLLMSGCGKKESIQNHTKANAKEIAQTVLNSQSGDLPQMSGLNYDDKLFKTMLNKTYGIEYNTISDGFISFVDGAYAHEITVFEFIDEETAHSAKPELKTHQNNHAGKFTGYKPEQEALANEGLIIQNGNYLIFIICDDTDKAKEAFYSCFKEDWSMPELIHDFISTDNNASTNSDSNNETTTTTEDPPINTNIDYLRVEGDYNHDAIVSAFQNNDASVLDDFNLIIYNRVKEAIEDNISSQMNDYEKELAICDYIILAGDYDDKALSSSVGKHGTANNENPYGMLINQAGICSGYSNTFQLFMDILGIECITVHGSSGVEEHAWNMVKLDGDWYCVDVTWDDRISIEEAIQSSNIEVTHSYFNVTSAYMLLTTHVWDSTGIPEASATEWSWENQQ